MKRKNEKGFALVLALVLLMVMSLLGGSLIVITSTDHQSNNSSDEYQQAFYVAETALLEAEKINESELRKSILKSQEALDLKRFDSTSLLIADLFNEILNRDPTKNEAEHYKYLVDIEEITEEEIRLELEKIKNNN